MPNHFHIFNRLCRRSDFVRKAIIVSLCFCVGCGDETNLSNPTVTGVAQKLDVSSSAIPSGGECPTEFTINGAGVSPPVEWTGAPAATKAFALSLWRLSRKASGEPPITLSYWVLYNIPADVKSLQKDSKDVGVMGISDRGKIYLPLQSKEPIVEHYYLTVFALSKELEFDNEKVDRRDLIKVIRDVTLAEGTLKFHFKQDGNHK